MNKRRQGELQEGTKPSVGVVGAGVMGTGIAQNLAQEGFSAIVVDVSDRALDQARDTIRKTIMVARLLKKSTDAEPADQVLARLQFTTDLASLSTSDFIIENTTEDFRIKAPIYEELDAICQENCIFIANTSCIPISQLASATKRPELVIGVHFMNPVPMKKTVEMIPSSQTSEQTLAKVKDLMEQLGKASIVVNDSPGFVSNRVLMVTINEAIRVVEENVADAEAVDEIFKSCFGHTMGPLETGDLIGLDTILLSLEVLKENFGEAKYEPCDLLKKMVADGRLGRKSGGGFHPYS